MAENSENSIAENKSSLKGFISSIATMTGDLSNITAPPFVLDPTSAVQVPAFSVQNTSLLCAPARSEDPAERALLVLKSFICGIRSQCYMGHTQKEGPKKPINSFLGELFIAKREDENGLTQILCEQVSHHPPTTACRIWNDKYGVSDESYNRTSMSFSGSVHIESIGLVLKSLTKFDEHYLLPIPDFKITSLLSTPSPNLTGTYYIPSTTGWTSVINFSEKGFLGSDSDKHNFEAQVFSEEQGEEKPRYTLEGSWYDEFSIRDNDAGTSQTINIETGIISKSTQLQQEPLDRQDPWETKKAWKTVLAALSEGNMSEVTAGKNMLEEGQRQMRQDEESEGKGWQPLFFDATQPKKVMADLVAKIPDKDVRKDVVETETAWIFNEEKWKSTKKPYHAPLRPDNTRTGEQSQTVNENHAERRSEGQPIHQFADGIDHKVGAADDGREAEADGVQIDIGRSPEKKHIEGITMNEPGPQAAQTGTREEYVGSGIEDMTLKEKHAIEDMLRDQYSTGNDERDYTQKKKRHNSK